VELEGAGVGRREEVLPDERDQDRESAAKPPTAPSANRRCSRANARML